MVKLSKEEAEQFKKDWPHFERRLTDEPRGPLPIGLYAKPPDIDWGDETKLKIEFVYW